MQTGLKRTLASLVSIAVSFALGMIVGVTGSKGGAPEQDHVKPSVKARGAIEETGADERMAILRNRVAELERKLAEKTAPEATAEKVEPDVGARPPERGPDGADWRAGIERFKKDHPDEYAKMEERRRNFMQRRQERAKSQLEFLASVDTANMTPAAKKTHERLMSLMARRQEFESKITPEAMMNATEEERRETFETMRETEHEMRRLREEERVNLMRVTAQEMGFTGEDADAVVGTISEIYEVTSGGFGPGGHGMFGGPRHGGGRGEAR